MTHPAENISIEGCSVFVVDLESSVSESINLSGAMLQMRRLDVSKK